MPCLGMMERCQTYPVVTIFSLENILIIWHGAVIRDVPTLILQLSYEGPDIHYTPLEVWIGSDVYQNITCDIWE